MYAVRWAKMAALYFVLGSTVGLVMGISEKFGFTAAHAHANLLGWVSMALIAVLYKLFPSMEQSKLAPVHFWVYQLGVPTFVAGLAALAANAPKGVAVPLVAAGGTVTLVAVILTAVVIWTNVTLPAAAAGKLPGRRSAR